MYKKVLSLLMACLILVSLLAGCGAKKADTQTQTQTETSNKDKFKGKEVTLYIRMMDAQDKWFRENTVKKFENEYGVKINVRTFENDTDLENILTLDKDKKTIALVKTPDTVILPLAKKGLFMPLEEAVGDRAKQDLTEYLDVAVQMGTIDGKAYYIPRKIETNTMLYSKSKVKDAVDNWQKFKDQINEMFKKVNGFGLPTDYSLEADPNQWDYYDLAVVGYYWANTEYNGVKEPRLAHRAKKYNGTVTELVNKAYQMGATQEDLLTMNAQAIKDAYKWEALFKNNNLYNPTMFQEEWSGGQIYNGYANGKVFLAFMHQIDDFFVHGGSHPTMTGYMKDPDDMGIAIQPQGVSLELKDGKPVKVGTHTANLSGWWWGIPVSTPDKELSYELARFITNHDNMLAECRNFGMMPVRKDISDKLDEAFTEAWMKDVFKAAMDQEEAGIQSMPQVTQWPEIQQLYIDSWYEAVVESDGSNIDKLLDEKYAPKAKEIMSK